MTQHWVVMKVLQLVTLLVASLLPSAALCADLHFEDYPALVAFKGTAAAPIFHSENEWPEGDEKFRASVTSVASQGPTFAGAFAIAKVSCGTGCVYIGVVNVNTGAVYSKMPFYSLTIGWDPARNTAEYAGLDYRLTSRLLVVEGWVDATRKGNKGKLMRNYYEWSGERFHLLRSTALLERSPRR